MKIFLYEPGEKSCRLAKAVVEIYVNIHFSLLRVFCLLYLYSPMRSIIAAPAFITDFKCRTYLPDAAHPVFRIFIY